MSQESPTTDIDGTVTVEVDGTTGEIAREELAESDPHLLLPDDYEENGIAGGKPVSFVGQRLHSQDVIQPRSDLFRRGPPEDCPYDTKDEVREQVDDRETQRRYLYGEGGDTIYFATVPDECPFCAAAIEEVIGARIKPNFGVLTTPCCHRILAGY